MFLKFWRYIADISLPTAPTEHYPTQACKN